MCLYDSNLICLDIKTLDSSLNILGYTNCQKCARSEKPYFENDMHYKNYQRLINVTFIQKSL